MPRIFLAVTVFFLALFSCNDNKAGGLLSKAPYNKLTDSIEQNPKNADLYYRRGSLLYSNNESAEAEADLRKAWELAPKEEYALGVSAILKQKNTDAALRFLEEALQKLPNSLFIQVQLAQGYRSKGELDKSLAICNRLIAQYPNNIDALLLKAEILKAQNKNAEALSTLEAAYQYAPGDVELVHTLAFDYAESKNPKVIALADSLIKADTENTHAEPHYFKGLYYENLENTVEAIKHFDEAIRINYNFLDAHMDKGQTLYNAKKFDEALKSFELAVTITPTYANSYYWIAKTQEAMGIKDEAKLNYQRAYGLDKTMTEAKEAAEKL